VNKKERALCEKAELLWNQAVEEGFTQTTDETGLTLPMFMGAHYAIGANKSFWTLSEKGFEAIQATVDSLEKLLADDDESGDVETSAPPVLAVATQPVVYMPAGEIEPDPRVLWRATHIIDDEENAFYNCVPVNGYTLRKYYEDHFPGKKLEYDGSLLYPSEIPLDGYIQCDELGEKVASWFSLKQSFEIINDENFAICGTIEVSSDEIVVWTQDLQVWQVYEYPDEENFFEAINLAFEENGENLLVIFKSVIS
jgi:hypothetical protein